MKFEDLSIFDLNLIKSNAAQKMIAKQGWDRFAAICEAVLDCIYSKGFNLSGGPRDLQNYVTKALEPEWTFGIQKSTLSSDDLIQKTFTVLKELNIDILKDETREATWSKLTDRHFNKYDDSKKPWMF
jgi:hypothetical protein